MNPMTTTNIFVLRLEGGRYYIGQSDTVTEMYAQHLNGSGSAWTKKYKPVLLEKIIERVSPSEENKVTMEYMLTYGMDRVRGGSYVDIELEDVQKEAIHRELWAASGLCSRCGRGGHFVKDCHAKTTVLGTSLEEEEEEEDEEEDEEEEEEEGKEGKEGKAKGEGEDEEEEEEDDEWSCEYCDRIFTTVFDCDVHEKKCKARIIDDRPAKETPNIKKEVLCHICGTTGHMPSGCPIRRHIQEY